jgi:hypothetical protein
VSALRRPGQRISPSKRIAYAEHVRQLLSAEPGMTLEDLMSITGAPKNMIIGIRRRWRSEREARP